MPGEKLGRRTYAIEGGCYRGEEAEELMSSCYEVLLLTVIPPVLNFSFTSSK